MRRALPFVLLAITAGCGSTGQRHEAVVYDDIDRERMAFIEDQAWSRGARVHWMNPPRKPAAPSGK